MNLQLCAGGLSSKWDYSVFERKEEGQGVNVPAELVQWARISIHFTEGSGNIPLGGFGRRYLLSWYNRLGF